MVVFSDMVKKSIEAFMDDFSMFGTTSDNCLINLERVLKRCEQTNLSKLGKTSLYGQRKGSFGS